jgi:hypothetical protein
LRKWGKPKTPSQLKRLSSVGKGREGGQEGAKLRLVPQRIDRCWGCRPPDPAEATHEHNDYVFERAVKRHKDEGDSQGRIDLYKK